MSVLAGTWGFKLVGQNFGAAGAFTATVGVDPRTPGVLQGLVAFKATSNNNGMVVRQETDTARYQIFPDCTGGTISLVLSSHPITFDFWFIEGRTEIYMVSIDNLATSAFVPAGTGIVVTGTASRVATDLVLQ